MSYPQPLNFNAQNNNLEIDSSLEISTELFLRSSAKTLRAILTPVQIRLKGFWLLLKGRYTVPWIRVYKAGMKIKMAIFVPQGHNLRSKV